MALPSTPLVFFKMQINKKTYRKPTEDSHPNTPPPLANEKEMPEKELLVVIL